MTAAMRDWIGVKTIVRFDSMRDAAGDLPPPWRVFPDYRPTSMVWRMGVGETYLAYWHHNYNELDSKSKRNYRRKHRPPLYWYWGYWNIESPAVAILIVVSGLLTWIPRIPLHIWYRMTAGSRIEIPD